MNMHESLGMTQQEFTTLDRLIAWLNEWARWCEAYRPSLGAKSPSFFGSGIHYASDLFDGQDDVCLRTIDSVIEEMRKTMPASHEAILKRYTGKSCFVFPRNNYELMLDKAHDYLTVVLPKKGVML